MIKSYNAILSETKGRILGNNKTLRAIGLMSGTSMDGVDAAIIETDGAHIKNFGPSTFVPYEMGFVENLRSLLGANPERKPNFEHIVGELTALQGDAVDQLLGENAISPQDIDLIGFHGHTVHHDPENGITIQIGDGQSLSNQTGIDVVADFRSADVAAGGQGAPLVPVFHQALSVDLEKPLAVINIGGVANITLLGEGDNILAFDTGPGNALIDDWVRRKLNKNFDDNGEIALSGTVNPSALRQLMDHPYFSIPAPKSLDRNSFDPSPVAGLSVEDGAATLAAFSVKAILEGCKNTSFMPTRWLICGGGRHNQAIMKMLQEATNVPVEPVESVGWQGDVLEAQAFGFLAIRVLYGLPTSLPSTTGVDGPVSGGVIFKPEY